MRKYLALLRFEGRTILRDPVSLFMCWFPLVLLALCVYAFPLVLAALDPVQALTVRSVTLLLLIAAITMGGFMTAGMTVFMLLEHKDEHTLHTIAATPAGLSGYLRFKVAYVYALSVLGILLVLAGTKLLAADSYVLMGVRLFDRAGFWQILSYSLVAGLFAPALALFLGALAKNKVEGFAWIKGSGMIALAPLLMVLPAFEGGRQYLLGLFPNFWAARGFLLLLYPQPDPANLPFAGYLAAGAAYSAALLAFAYRLFLRRQQY